MNSLSTQYDNQRHRACMWLDFKRAERIQLVVQRFKDPDIPPIISIVGCSIVPYMIEHWRMQGVSVHVIEVITAADRIRDHRHEAVLARKAFNEKMGRSSGGLP